MDSSQKSSFERRNVHKRKVILLAPLPPPYMGPTMATEVLLHSSFVHEFDVDHLDTSDHRSLTSLGKIDFRNVYLALKHYSQLFLKLASNESDIVYIPISQTTLGYLRDLPFICISKMFRKKVILHLRGGRFREFYEKSNRLMRAVIRSSLRMIDKMIILGDCLKPLFARLLPTEKLAVVPNGKDLPELSGPRAESLNTNVHVLFLSNLMKAKGYWDVLMAVKEVIREVQDVTFVFAGAWLDESEKHRCEDLIKAESIHEHVEFMGTVTGEKKYQLLESSQVFVMPSYSEGHPWVIIEAMAAGLPIVATDVGAIRESVIDGENGFLVPVQSDKEIADRLLLLVQDRELRERMGQKSREIYLKKFTTEHFVNNMITVFKKVLDS